MSNDDALPLISRVLREVSASLESLGVRERRRVVRALVVLYDANNMDAEKRADEKETSR